MVIMKTYILSYNLKNNPTVGDCIIRANTILEAIEKLYTDVLPLHAKFDEYLGTISRVEEIEYSKYYPPFLRAGSI